MRMIHYTKFQFCSKENKKHFPKFWSKLGISIWNNILGYSMYYNHILHEILRNITRLLCRFDNYKMSYLTQISNHYHYGNMLSRFPWYSYGKFHGNELPLPLHGKWDLLNQSHWMSIIPLHLRSPRIWQCTRQHPFSCAASNPYFSWLLTFSNNQDDLNKVFYENCQRWASSSCPWKVYTKYLWNLIVHPIWENNSYSLFPLELAIMILLLAGNAHPNALPLQYFL